MKKSVNNNEVISNAEQYRLLIEGELLALVRECMVLEQAHSKTKQASAKRRKLEDQLYDLYGQVGWSVVYQMNELPF